MRAAVVHEFGATIAIEERPVPMPGPGELLVEVVACGVCHTDLHAVDGVLVVNAAARNAHAAGAIAVSAS